MKKEIYQTSEESRRQKWEEKQACRCPECDTYCAGSLKVHREKHSWCQDIHYLGYHCECGCKWKAYDDEPNLVYSNWTKWVKFFLLMFLLVFSAIAVMSPLPTFWALPSIFIVILLLQ